MRLDYDIINPQSDPSVQPIRLESNGEQQTVGSRILRVDAGRRIMSWISIAPLRYGAGTLKILEYWFHNSQHRLDTNVILCPGLECTLAFGHIYFRICFLSLFTYLAALNGSRYSP